MAVNVHEIRSISHKTIIFKLPFIGGQFSLPSKYSSQHFIPEYPEFLKHKLTQENSIDLCGTFCTPSCNGSVLKTNHCYLCGFMVVCALLDSRVTKRNMTLKCDSLRDACKVGQLEDEVVDEGTTRRRIWKRYRMKLWVALNWLMESFRDGFCEHCDALFGYTKKFIA